MQRETGLRRGLLFFAACCAAYVVSAFYLNTYGPVAPLTMDWYGLDPAGQGMLMTIQSIGGSAVAVYLAFRGDAFNKVYLVAAGCLVLGVGCLLIGLAPPYALCCCLAAVSGIGFTLIDVNVNGAVADLYPAQKGTLLSIAHACYGVGGMIAPALVAVTASVDNPRSFTVPFFAVGTVSCVLFVWSFFSGRSIQRQLPGQNAGNVAAPRTGAVLRTPLAWILLAAGILYFTFQLGVASWLPSWAIEEGMSFDDANFLTSGFFAGQLVMGFAAALLLRFMSARRLFALAGFVSAACMAAALVCKVPMLITVLVIASGFLQGAGVITLIIILTDAFPDYTASASSIQVIGANTAAVTAPLWIGAAAVDSGYTPPLLLCCVLYAAGCAIVLLCARSSETMGQPDRR